MNQMESKNIAIKVSIVSILMNTLLSVIKLFAGVFGKSSAMLSDAIHSMSDVFSSIVVIIGVKLSSKKEDKEHPYGHERLECVVAILLAMTLVFVGSEIGISGIQNIINRNYESLVTPEWFTLIVAMISIFIKEGMYWYTKIAAKKINSSALMADAWHHRSDSLSSIGSFIGILGARMGYPILDSVASIIICIFIIKAGYEIFIDAIKKMIDVSCDDNTVEKIRSIASSQKGVVKIDMIKTRLFGDKIYVDLEIRVDGNKSLREAHEIAHIVHDEIEKEMKLVKHCMIHVNPE